MKEINAKDAKRLRKIGAKLRKLRIEAGYSNYEFFAWEHKIPRSSYQYIEEGRNCQLTTLMKILNIHGISLKEFFSDIE